MARLAEPCGFLVVIVELKRKHFAATIADGISEHSYRIDSRTGLRKQRSDVQRAITVPELAT